MDILLFILFISGGMAGAIAGNKLTLPAALTGGVLGAALYTGVGWIGIVLMGGFFLFAVIATSWKKRKKQALGLTQENKGRRNTGQVLANGGVGGLLGIIAVILPQHSFLLVFLIAAAFSSATADTVSSELGSIYGKQFYDIISWKKGQRGLDGMVSTEGTAYGVLGSCLIASVYSIAQGWNQNFLWIVLAGTAGNFADSYLGATLERKGKLSNDAVNFLNTAIAVLIAYLLHKI